MFLITALAVPCLLAIASPAAVCSDREHFTFRVERARPGPVDGIEVHVAAQGPTGVTQGMDTVRSGMIRVCIVGGTPGEIVEVRLGPTDARVFRLLYPPGGRLPMTNQGSPTIVICEVDRDCSLLTMREAKALLRRARPAATLSPEDKQALFRQWVAGLMAQGIDHGELVELLRRKERQVEGSLKASALLSRFDTHAREIVLSFRRDAPEALDRANTAPFKRLNEAIARYNPVFEELREKGDSYRKATADYWGKARSSQFGALVEDALAIHERIYSFNELSKIISDCRNSWKCPDQTGARSQVLHGVDELAVEVDAKLDGFAREKVAFLEALDEELFEAPPASEPSPGGTVVQ